MTTSDPRVPAAVLLGVLALILGAVTVLWSALHVDSELRRRASSPPAAPPVPQGPRASSVRTQLVVVSVASAWLPLVLTVGAMTAWPDAPWAWIWAAEGGLAAWLVLVGRRISRLRRAMATEASLGYTTFVRLPFGDPVPGVWVLGPTGVPLGTPAPLAPEFDRASQTEDAYDSLRQASVPPPGWAPAVAPPPLLPGRSARALSARSAGVQALAFPAMVVGFVPALLMPTGWAAHGLLMAVSMSVALVSILWGWSLSAATRDRARAEAAAGYTTLAGGADVGYFNVPWSAQRLVPTDLLWHLDDTTGKPIRPPIVPRSRPSAGRAETPG